MLKIAIPFIAFWFASVLGIPQKIKFKVNKVYPNATLKPFTCDRCMGFWLAFIHELYFGFTVDSIWYVPMCSLGAWGIRQVVSKFNILLQ